jgi:hypothetical protein
MKQIIQLDGDGYYIGETVADESPLEPGVYLLPKGTVVAPTPTIPDGKRAKWEGVWVFEDVPTPITEPEPPELTYAQKRRREYPPIGDQLDALFHAGVFPEWMATQIQAVKNKYPKEQ